MKSLQWLMLLVLILSSVEAFTTKKKERRTTLQFVPFTKEAAREQWSQEQQSGTSNTGSAMFAFSPGTSPVQVVQYYEPEEEPDVSYSIALVSCMLSLALGFGLGYGT